MARFGLSMPKNPSNNLLFVHIDGFEVYLIFWVPNLSYLPLVQEGQLPGSRHSAVVIISPVLHLVIIAKMKALT